MSVDLYWYQLNLCLSSERFTLEAVSGEFLDLNATNSRITCTTGNIMTCYTSILKKAD